MKVPSLENHSNSGFFSLQKYGKREIHDIIKKSELITKQQKDENFSCEKAKKWGGGESRGMKKLWEKKEIIKNTGFKVLSKENEEVFNTKKEKSEFLCEKFVVEERIFKREAVNLLLGLENIFGEFKENKFIIKGQFKLIDGLDINGFVEQISEKGVKIWKLNEVLKGKQRNSILIGVI